MLICDKVTTAAGLYDLMNGPKEEEREWVCQKKVHTIIFYAERAHNRL